MKNNLENLRLYVCASEPKVNKLLRNNQDASELTFDELFKASSEPQTLFRVLNNKHIDTQNNLFSDKAYLSCSKDIDCFINHINGDDIACIQFHIPQGFLTIEVSSLLPEQNDEKEVILPRGLVFNIESEEKYSGREEIEKFLEIVNSDLSVREICDIYQIKTIHFYKLTLP